MKKTIISLLVLYGLSMPLCMAQEAQTVVSEDFKPATLNQPGKEYPMVNSQGYARFRVIAPDAQSVVAGLGGKDAVDHTNR